MAKKILRTIIICAAVTVIVAVIIAILSNKITKQSKTSADDPDKAVLEELESMYAEGDYSSITGKVRSDSLYSGKFGKYSQIADVYYYVQILEQYLEDIEKGDITDQQTRKTYIEYSISYGCIAINTCNSYINDDSDFGNQDALTDILNTVTERMTDTLQLSKEELDKLLVVKTAEDITEYTNMLYDRLYSQD